MQKKGILVCPHTVVCPWTLWSVHGPSGLLLVCYVPAIETCIFQPALWWPRIQQPLFAHLTKNCLRLFTVWAVRFIHRLEKWIDVQLKKGLCVVTGLPLILFNALFFKACVVSC